MPPRGRALQPRVALARLQTPEGAKPRSLRVGNARGRPGRAPSSPLGRSARGRARCPRRQPRGRRTPGRGESPAGGRRRVCASPPHAVALRCGAGPGTLRAHGGGWRAPRCLFARRALGRRAELPGPPGEEQPPGAGRLPPDGRRPLAPAPAWPGWATRSRWRRRRRRRRRRDCLLPAPRVSSPRHREGQGDWARGPRPVSARAPGPPLARALSPRARGRCRLTWCWPQP